MISKSILQGLSAAHITYTERLSLKAHSTFRIGGTAELGVFPKTVEQLQDALALLRKAELPFEVVGNGSNLFFGDGVVRGALVFTAGLSELRREDDRLIASAGVTLAALAGLAAEESLTGLEFARGIPGTVGGALFMNAGAYGGEMAQITVESRALNRETGEICTLTEHAFGYRTSIYMEHKELICIEGSFALRRGDPEQIRATMRELAARRREKQPLEYPSCGSYFKRPEGHFAGKLIEDCGLKGYRVGDAAVSEKHAGFLINLGQATASDMLRLEAHVRETVRRQFGIELEREIRFIPTE